MPIETIDPFGELDLTDTELRETSYEIFIGACRSTAEEVNDSPIEQVRLTVPITDDPTLPCLTFTAWKLMAATLSTKPIRVLKTRWSFSLNPGPFNLKEHGLITIFMQSQSSPSFILVIYNKIVKMIDIFTDVNVQMHGYGWAGLFRKFLVDSPYMWWPANLVQVSLFRALHDEEKRPKRASKAVVLPHSPHIKLWILHYSQLCISIRNRNLICLLDMEGDSVTAQQIGSSMRRLGVGAFGLDWATLSAFLGSPLATPGFAIMNIFAGLALLTCEGFGGQLQLPYWWVLLGIGLALVFRLPIGAKVPLTKGKLNENLDGVRVKGLVNFFWTTTKSSGVIIEAIGRNMQFEHNHKDDL
ncbi:oligopeptide transporter 1-like protein, partial [Tanacetum coccineum]